LCWIYGCVLQFAAQKQMQVALSSLPMSCVGTFSAVRSLGLGQSMDVAIVCVHVTCFLNATDLRHACDKSHISPPSSRPRPLCLSLVHPAFSHPKRQLSRLGHLLEGRANQVKTSLFFRTTNPAARPMSSRRPPRGGVEWSKKSAPLSSERYLRYPPTMSLHPSRLPNCTEIQVPAPYRNSGLKSRCCKKFDFFRHLHAYMRSQSLLGECRASR